MNSRRFSLPFPHPSSVSNPRFQEAIRFLESRINYETYKKIPYRELEDRLHQLRILYDALKPRLADIPVVHVAGTKGKGSVCIILEQILKEANLKIGRFSSPHLHSLLERFTINGCPCAPEPFSEILLSLREKVELWEKGENSSLSKRSSLTYFDLLTLFAFEYFSRERVDLSLFEVGLGGRLDSTNICEPRITIISSISFDHIQQLGPTLGDIAREKAGIIKPGIPVISGVQKGEPAEAIREIARKNQAPLIEIHTDFQVKTRPDFPSSFNYDLECGEQGLSLHLKDLTQQGLGNHQIRNASLAITACALLRKGGWNISEDAIRKGLRNYHLPARVEVLWERPTLIVDGAHNQASIHALIETLEQHYPEKKRRLLLFGAMQGKDVEGMLHELLRFFHWIIFTQYEENPRSFPALGLYNIALSCLCRDSASFNEEILESGNAALHTKDRNVLPLSNPGPLPGRSRAAKFGEIIPNIREAFERLCELSNESDLICTAGSLYIAAKVRELAREKSENE